MAVMAVDVDAAVAVKERLEAFAGEVLAEAMNRPVQLVNGGLYLRGLLERGPRKSLEALVERLSGWRRRSTLRCGCWTTPGFRDGKDSPGVKRQYSGTLGKTGNCQIGVSVHAVGRQGTVPLGWALYLPEDWCQDRQRRRKAKIPDEVAFKTKP